MNYMLELYEKFNISWNNWNNEKVNKSIVILEKELKKRKNSERILTLMQEKNLLGEIRLLLQMTDGCDYTKDDFKPLISEMFGWAEIVDFYIIRLVNSLIEKRCIIRIERDGKAYYHITPKGLKRVE